MFRMTVAGILSALPGVLTGNVVDTRSAAGLGRHVPDSFSSVSSWDGAPQGHRDQLLFPHRERQVDTSVHHAARVPAGPSRRSRHGEVDMYAVRRAWGVYETSRKVCVRLSRHSLNSA